MDKKDDLIPVEIDLNAAKKGEISESFLRIMGGFIETIMGRMFGTNAVPISIRGTRSQIDAFGKTLQGEKRYMQAYQKYGLNDPQTYNSKYALDRAIQGFERETGIKWPMK